MSLRINHNIAALNGHRNMLKNDMRVSASLEKLSSGLRINKAADDAAGLIVSEQMRAQIGGLSQAIRNSENAVSMVQTAEGAMDEVNSLLLKARDLALHAANDGANDQNQLVADQSELDNIVDSVNRIGNNTQFGTKKILDGSLASATSQSASVTNVEFGGQFQADLDSSAIVKGFYSVQVDTIAKKAASTLNMTGTDIITGTNNALSSMALTDQFQKGFTISINGASVAVTSGTTKAQFVQQLNAIGQSAGFTAVVALTATIQVGPASGATAAVTQGQIALISNNYGDGQRFDLQYVAGATGVEGTLSGTLVSGQNAGATIYALTAGEGGIATTGSTAYLVLTGKGLSLFSTSQSGAGFRLSLADSIQSGTVLIGAIDATNAGATFQVGANLNQTATVTLNSVKASTLGRGASSTYDSLNAVKGGSLISGQANEVLKVVDKAIDQITVTRGKLGAFQANTLESGINSMQVAHENLTAAESTIRDVDFAEESANFTKNNIMVQAATAMMAQANQLPQNVLKLLG